MYKYLLWDIDGTVLDFTESENYAIHTLFRRFDLGECDEEMLRVYSRINRRYWEALEKKEMSKSEILVGRFREFFSLYGIDPALAEEFNEAYQVTLGDHVVFCPCAEEVLRHQKGKYRLIAITNGTRKAQEKKLKMSGLDKIFDEVYISEDVGYDKPDVRYFAHVLVHAGIEDRHEALVIGDSLSSDMKGGVNAGIDTCWYDPKHTDEHKGLPVTYVIHSLGEVEDILENEFE